MSHWVQILECLSVDLLFFLLLLGTVAFIGWKNQERDS